MYEIYRHNHLIDDLSLISCPSHSFNLLIVPTYFVPNNTSIACAILLAALYPNNNCTKTNENSRAVPGP